MPSESTSYGFAPSRSARSSSAQLTLEQYVSPSVIDKEAKASKPQRGNTQLQREASPPEPTAVSAEAPRGGKKKKKGKKGSKGETPAPPAGPQGTRREGGELRPPQLPKGQLRPGQGKGETPSKREFRPPPLNPLCSLLVRETTSGRR